MLRKPWTSSLYSSNLNLLWLWVRIHLQFELHCTNCTLLIASAHFCFCVSCVNFICVLPIPLRIIECHELTWKNSEILIQLTFTLSSWASEKMRNILSSLEVFCAVSLPWSWTVFGLFFQNIFKIHPPCFKLPFGACSLLSFSIIQFMFHVGEALCVVN